MIGRLVSSWEGFLAARAVPVSGTLSLSHIRLKSTIRETGRVMTSDRSRVMRPPKASTKRGEEKPKTETKVLLLMAEILHQLIGSLSHYL